MAILKELKGEKLDSNGEKVSLFEKEKWISITTKQENSKLEQYHYPYSNHQDCYLYTYLILTRKIPLESKILIFTESEEHSYKLRLFLERFGCRSGVLCSELPLNSRMSTVTEFNKGSFNILIATDKPDHLKIDKKKKTLKKSSSSSSSAVDKSEEKDYGVSRGIDFKSVNYIINFDLPSSTESYIHRSGRTARLGASGTVISYSPATNGESEKDNVIMEEENLPSQFNRLVWQAILNNQRAEGKLISFFNLEDSLIEAFKYRASDALRSVTGQSILKYRKEELSKQILKSEKLKSFFEEHPDDLRAIKESNQIFNKKNNKRKKSSKNSNSTKILKKQLNAVPTYLTEPEAGVPPANGQLLADESAQSGGGGLLDSKMLRMKKKASSLHKLKSKQSKKQSAMSKEDKKKMIKKKKSISRSSSGRKSRDALKSFKISKAASRRSFASTKGRRKK